MAVSASCNLTNVRALDMFNTVSIMVAIYPTGGDCGISGGGTDEDGWGGQCVWGGGGGEGGIPNFTPL